MTEYEDTLSQHITQLENQLVQQDIDQEKIIKIEREAAYKEGWLAVQQYHRDLANSQAMKWWQSAVFCVLFAAVMFGMALITTAATEWTSWLIFLGAAVSFLGDMFYLMHLSGQRRAAVEKLWQGRKPEL